jgi:hypothetical protein
VEFARRNASAPPDLTADARDEFFREASFRYRVYWEALRSSRITTSKNRLIAMYLDGSQHHIRQAVALHLTTLAKGQVTQPWQGEGVLLDNGHGKLNPFVLTAGRKPQYAIRTVDGLNIFSGAGFERIGIAAPMAAPHGAVPAPTAPTAAEFRVAT